MGEAIDKMEIENKMYIAVGDQLKILQAVLSYLAARKETAMKYLKCENPIAKEQYLQYVEFGNEGIKKILGV